MEDMENSQVSAAMLSRVHEINAMEEERARGLEDKKIDAEHLDSLE